MVASSRRFNVPCHRCPNNSRCPSVMGWPKDVSTGSPEAVSAGTGRPDSAHIAEPACKRTTQIVPRHLVGQESVSGPNVGPDIIGKHIDLVQSLLAIEIDARGNQILLEAEPLVSVRELESPG